MSRLCHLALGLLLLLGSSITLAAIEVYDFDNPELEGRYYQLIEVLRCPKCQNQNIADSNAPLSADLRQRVHGMLHEGHSDSEITAALVERYGEFITYRPPLNLTTLLLWFGPLLGVLLAAFLVARWVRANQAQTDTITISEAERQRLAIMLGSQEDAPR